MPRRSEFRFGYGQHARRRVTVRSLAIGTRKTLLEKAGKRRDDISSIVLVEKGEGQSNNNNNNELKFYFKSDAVLRIGAKLELLRDTFISVCKSCDALCADIYTGYGVYGGSE